MSGGETEAGAKGGKEVVVTGSFGFGGYKDRISVGRKYEGGRLQEGRMVAERGGREAALGNLGGGVGSKD